MSHLGALRYAVETGNADAIASAYAASQEVYLRTGQASTFADAEILKVGLTPEDLGVYSTQPTEQATAHEEAPAPVYSSSGGVANVSEREGQNQGLILLALVAAFTFFRR